MNRITDLARLMLFTLLAVSHVQCRGMSNLRTDINSNAEAVARTELFIDAPPKAVWSVLTDVGRWTEWMPEFTSARLDGPLAPGSVIFWEPHGQKVESRLVVVEAERRLIWNGTGGAVHIWELIPTAHGTLLRNVESIDDWKLEGVSDGSALLNESLKVWNSRIAQMATR